MFNRICWNSAVSPGKLVPLAVCDGYRPLCAVDARGQTEGLSQTRPSKKARTEVPPEGQLHPNAPAQCRKLHVRAIPLRHSVSAQGYVVAEERRRLRAEYVAGPRHNWIPHAARQTRCPNACAHTRLSVRLHVEAQSTPSRYARGHAGRCDCRVPTLTIRTRRAARRKHVLWSKLKPVIEEFGEVQFVLIHFSGGTRARGAMSC